MMRDLLLILWLAATTLSCGHFGQFQEEANALLKEWARHSAALEELTAKVAAEQSRIEDRMSSIPIRTGLIGNFGEDYLSSTDQLSAKLVGHKGRFDALAAQIRDFAGQWAVRETEVDQLRQGLRAGELPRDTPARINALNAEMTGVPEKLSAWGKELADVVAQWEAIARQISGQ